ncbi:MAG TPA: OmpA family protein [Candidatus Kryptonia bacterium]|nr:OmpA family protein [Candidatus Kryptonia bacterium]
MKGVARGSFLVMVVALGWIAAARADESSDVTDADRVYRNFTREAATVQPGQIRLEVRGMALGDENNTFLNLNGFPAPQGTDQVEGGIFDFLTSYGLGKSSEVGAVVPVITQSLRTPAAAGLTQTTSDTDIGDVQLYGKFKHQVAQHCSVAGGVELSLPTGIEHKTFGTGELGVNPFVATRYQMGHFGVGIHAGYEMYTGDVPDIFNYSAEAFFRPSSTYNIHAELSGRLFNDVGRRIDDLVILPGIDFNVSPSLTLRPTGLVGVTGRATDWGIGAGVAYTFSAPTMPVAQAAPPPAPVAAPAPAPLPAKKKIVLRGVNFDFDKSNIRADAAPVLDEAASTLKEATTISIAVEGHTDSRGSDEYNQGLSERRANAVRDYLADHGIDKSRMTAAGFGESRPVASNDTDEGRAQNRRVELRVTSE